MTAPTFLVISPSKTGSTWLARNLNHHARIFIPAIKEVNYFSFLHKYLELDWYREVFRPACGRAAGDASPCYALLPSTAIREIYRLFPGIKLIYLMRDPVERAWSHAKHNCAYREANFSTYRRSIDDVSAEMWLENFSHPWPVAHGDYLGQLRRWTTVFPREQLFVGFFEQIVNDPRALLRHVLRYLGVEPEPDFSKYPLFQKILEGPRKSLPPGLRTHLGALHASRSQQLADYLGATFHLTCPPEWAPASVATPPAPSPTFATVVASDRDDDYLAALLHANPPTQVILIEEGFYGYNLIWRRGRLFAFRQIFGPIGSGSMIEEDFDQSTERAEALTATTLGTLKEAVRQANQRDYEISATLLVEQDYLDFNLLLHKGRYIALAQGLGAVDPRHIDDDVLQRLECRQEAFCAPTLDELKTMVRCAIENSPACRPKVRLVEEGHAGYNLVSYRGRFFAFPQQLGRCELRDIIDTDFAQYESRREGLTAATLAELKELVRSAPLRRRTLIRRCLSRGLRVLRPLRSLIQPARPVNEPGRCASVEDACDSR